MNVPVAL